MFEKVTTESGRQNGISRLTALRLALVAGFFSLAVIFLLLSNYNDMRQNDPLSSVNSQKLDNLVIEHRRNPGDEAVKKDVQVLDQRLRQNYFNSQVKARIGICLLLAGLAVLIVCLKKALVFPIVPGTGTESSHAGYSRLTLAAIAVFLVIVVIVINLIQSHSG
ncbi:MAG: hypothetical protein WC637_19605 [Victivallales bacterium]|jgi:preprotein translocase subunit SecG